MEHKRNVCLTRLIGFGTACLFMSMRTLFAQTPLLPPVHELNAPFGEADRAKFLSPPQVYRPETWFHFIGGNVSLEGITADLEAVAAAGISGIQLFHGQFGGEWPGVKEQITCLGLPWDNAVKHTAEECRRLGLRFTMQNCPGWAMSGGPWIEPANAMRHLAWSRTDVNGGKTANLLLPVPEPNDEPWRDYRDIAVLAFPTPIDDTGTPLRPLSVKSLPELPWTDCLSGKSGKPLKLAPVDENTPYTVEVTFDEPVVLRTVEFPNIEGFNHAWCYEPGVTVTVQAVHPDGTAVRVLHAEMPASSWQDDRPVSLACSESRAAVYRISIVNRHDMSLRYLHLYAAARKNNWESEAGWTLRAVERSAAHPRQSPDAFVQYSRIRDISSSMDERGRLIWTPPDEGKWTVMRIGHVNAGQKNGPAPPEGTGWECDKLSESGAGEHFAGYIGRLAGKDGPLAGGLLNGMLMDSWECKTQTWTAELEETFGRRTGYPLRRWLPAVFGYVIGDHETTGCFLHDWRTVIGDLFVDKFYGGMARLAKDNNLSIVYETAAGDIFPADVLEYFKHADVPMCEFWQPFSDSHVGSLNFKPIKPTASAARMYGKPRVAAEAFTSFALTWDEHWEMLKEVANVNSIEGVTHLVFHTYTHNPQIGFPSPGTSFGSGIGTPFLRGQTWWKHMPEFVAYLSRCSYLLERGRSVSDVLWYLGDEINHKPNQNAPFPEGFKYDYCNPDVLLNRIKVRDGKLVTPEGTAYRMLWLPDNERMTPQTTERLLALVREGAVVVGNAPRGIATLSGGKAAKRRFAAAVRALWGDGRSFGVRKTGKGLVVSGMLLSEAMNELHLAPDVTGGNALWLHRQTDGADWYFVCPPKGESFDGTLSFHSTGAVEIWDPLTGASVPADARQDGARTSVTLNLPHAGSCFVIFRHTGEPVPVARTKHPTYRPVPFDAPWTLSFPTGWGAPDSLQTNELKAWKELDVSAEAKAFSGSVTYTTSVDAGMIEPDTRFVLDCGEVEMIAVVSLNGKPVRTLWSSPYRVDLSGMLKSGKNILTIEVTGTWFNRLVFDAGLPANERKTWTINGPAKNAPLRNSGLIGPVVLLKEVL